MKPINNDLSVASGSKKQKIDINSSLLLIVDMQNGFLNENSKHIVPNVKRLIDLWEKLGGRFAFTQFINEPGSAYEHLIGWTRLRSSPEIDIIDELSGYTRLVFKKHGYTAFIPAFKEYIKAHHFDALVLCGIATDGCVLETAVDAFQMGLCPVVIEDACASHAGEPIHEMGLTLIARFIGKDQILKFDGLFEVDNG